MILLTYLRKYRLFKYHISQLYKRTLSVDNKTQSIIQHSLYRNCKYTKNRNYNSKLHQNYTTKNYHKSIFNMKTLKKTKRIHIYIITENSHLKKQINFYKA